MFEMICQRPMPLAYNEVCLCFQAMRYRVICVFYALSVLSRPCVSSDAPDGYMYIINVLSSLSVCFQVMSQRVIRIFYAFSIFSILITTVLPTPATTILCEARCETSTPFLIQLKSLWHRMSKRIGKDGMKTWFIIKLYRMSKSIGKTACKRDLLIDFVTHGKCNQELVDLSIWPISQI